MGVTKFKLLKERIKSGLGLDKTFFPFYDSNSDTDFRVSMRTLISFIGDYIVSGGQTSFIVVDAAALSDTDLTNVPSIIDTVSIVADETIFLLPVQTDKKENGIYKKDSSNVAYRVDNYDTNTEIQNTFIFVKDSIAGSNKNKIYVAEGTIDVNVSDLNIIQKGGGGSGGGSTTDDITNMSTVSGTSATDALNTLQNTKEDSSNKSTSTGDSGSSTKFPVWSVILTYFSTSRIKTILGQASASVDGWLSSTDWNTFNNKQNALGYTPENVVNKGVANGYIPSNASNKIDLSYLPDVILGQLLYGGIVDASTAIATLTTNAKTKLGTGSSSITLTNNTNAITGYVANEGVYYITTVTGTFAGIDLDVGDWLISIGSAWKKVDNTDAVSSVNGKTGVVVLNTDDVAESGAPINKWFTNARALASVLTGLSAASGTYTATDTFLTAFGKIKYLLDNIATTYQVILTDVNFGSFINGLSSKTTPVDADYSIEMDSADSNKAKKVSWANRKATLKTYFDTVYTKNYPITLRLTSTNAASATSTSYYFGMYSDLLNISAAQHSLYSSVAGTLNSIHFQIYCGNNGVVTTNSFTAELRINNTTDVLISNSLNLSSTVPISVIQTSGLGQSLTTSDYFCIKITTPSSGTMAQGLRVYTTLNLIP